MNLELLNVEWPKKIFQLAGVYMFRNDKCVLREPE